MTRARWALVLGGLLSACLEPRRNVLEFKDVVPPSVRPETAPAPNAVVDPAAPITVVFSETMDAASLDAGLLLLQAGVERPRSLVLPVLPEGSVPPQIQREDVPYAVGVVPSAPLAPGTAYELLLTTAVTDYEGNPLPSEVRIPFSTRP